MLHTLAAEIVLSPEATAAGGATLAVLLGAIKLGDRLWLGSRGNGKQDEESRKKLDTLLNRECAQHHKDMAGSLAKLIDISRDTTQSVRAQLEIERMRHEALMQRLDQIDRKIDGGGRANVRT